MYFESISVYTILVNYKRKKRNIMVEKLGRHHLNQMIQVNITDSRTVQHHYLLKWYMKDTPSLLRLLLLLSRVSHVQLCATPWMAAHQPPLSLGFSRQEHWSGLPFPSPSSPPRDLLPLHHLRGTFCPFITSAGPSPPSSSLWDLLPLHHLHGTFPNSAQHSDRLRGAVYKTTVHYSSRILRSWKTKNDWKTDPDWRNLKRQDD